MDRNEHKHTRVRHLHRVRRRLVDGRSNYHFYHRKTRDKLPSPTSPDFMPAYLAAEHRLASESQESQRLNEGRSRPVNSAVSKSETKRAATSASFTFYTIEEAAAVVQEIADAQAKSDIAKHAHDKAGTLYHACLQFQSSNHYRALPLRVRTGFQDVLKWLPYRDATTPLTGISRNFIRDLRNNATCWRGYRFSNMALALMQTVLAWSVANGTLKENPATAVPNNCQPKAVPSRDRRRIAAARALLPALSDSTNMEITGR